MLSIHYHYNLQHRHFLNPLNIVLGLIVVASEDNTTFDIIIILSI